MIKYRPQRYLLKDAMKEYRIFSTVDEMFKYLINQNKDYFTKDNLTISKDYGPDKRVDWKETRKILTSRYGSESYDEPLPIGWCSFEEEKHLQEYIDELTDKLYENLDILNVTKDWTAFDWQEYEHQKLLKILDPYKKQIDILNAQLLVSTTLLKQIANDMETVSDKLTESAYNSTCSMSESCDSSCLFYVECLAGCYYKHLKEIKDFLKRLEDNSNA